MWCLSSSSRCCSNDSAAATNQLRTSNAGQEDAASPPSGHPGGSAFARATASDRFDPVGTPRRVQDERAVLLLSARACVRRACAKIRRLLPLPDRRAAAAFGIRDPRYRPALEGSL